ncbi:hypothetical protein NDU88_008561 [Pleurodeles waltl]|uniref:Uncharacterized protein n=1 Tax=Pleurodeles waltl TaxID=8319 RepID=A0AAV7PWZ6_PLEWA|nr:hypothetical protein NDU88_008561 [Pleurodeles waltl]
MKYPPVKGEEIENGPTSINERHLGILRVIVSDEKNCKTIAEDEELDYDPDSEELGEGELREWERMDRVKEEVAQGGLVWEVKRQQSVFSVLQKPGADQAIIRNDGKLNLKACEEEAVIRRSAHLPKGREAW